MATVIIKERCTYLIISRENLVWVGCPNVLIKAGGTSFAAPKLLLGWITLCELTLATNECGVCFLALAATSLLTNRKLAGLLVRPESLCRIWVC